MPRERGNYDALRRLDRFAREVTFTFNEKKNFPTPCGGLITCIIYLAVLTWLCSRILEAVGDSYVSQSTITDVTIDSDGFYPLYELTPQKMIIASKLE